MNSVYIGHNIEQFWYIELAELFLHVAYLLCIIGGGIIIFCLTNYLRGMDS